MRKLFGIAIGCILLCGLVMAAMLAVPPPTNNLIIINLDPETDGVDEPWFVLSKKGKDTVQWTNGCGLPCKVSFGPQSPFVEEPIDVGADATSKQYDAINAPNPPKNWEKTKPNDVYIVYKYSIKCDGTTFDPGGGVKP